MATRLIVRLLVVGFMVTGGWAVGPVLATDQDKDKEQGDHDRKDRDHGDRDRSDFALFDGTNSVPVFSSMKLPVPYVFLASPTL